MRFDDCGQNLFTKMNKYKKLIFPSQAYLHASEQFDCLFFSILFVWMLHVVLGAVAHCNPVWCITIRGTTRCTSRNMPFERNNIKVALSLCISAMMAKTVNGDMKCASNIRGIFSVAIWRYIWCVPLNMTEAGKRENAQPCFLLSSRIKKNIFNLSKSNVESSELVILY